MQTSFDPKVVDKSCERVTRLIQHVARGWRRAVNLRMAPLGLTEATWLPLLYLHKAGSVRQGELAEFLGLDRSSVVRLVDALASQGLVERQDDAEDRRAKRIVLTPAAAPVVKAAQDAASAVRAMASDGLDAQDLAVTEGVLAAILAKLPQAAEEMPA